MLHFRHQASIQRNLINSVSMVFGLILLAVFISVDQSLDDWVEQQFDQTMINRANYLKGQIKVVDHSVVFNFNQQFLPQFSSKKDAYFYQLWQNGKTIARSPSLEQYPAQNLILYDIPLRSTRVITVLLPNGETGRASLSYFIPSHIDQPDEQPAPVYLTVYQATVGLDRLKIMVDILLISAFILATLIMRYITVSLIKRGLSPLQQLNQEIKEIAETSDTSQLSRQLSEPKRKVEEIEPIRKELNAFIHSNRQLIENEKRITGDIAHELKTPIAELIALTEIYIQYPQDERISKTYQHDMLSIANRMKGIVENLLLLQRTSSLSMNKQLESLSLESVLEQITRDLSFKYPDIGDRLSIDLDGQDEIVADRFSIETLLVNLLDNALFYSPEQTLITIRWNADHQRQLEVRNQTATPLSPQDLEHIVQPLFQLDTSRTRSDRHGLGLSIVSNICRQNGYQFDLKHSTDQEFVARVYIPQGPELPSSDSLL
ncbi:sensor histidine kinase [Celerinatantimonas sp. YJH-8]|uniref:sensor histidine kinase n=1 Tax=Celerinatantimonas sp. YJH-8 TaxID=3228714 RepID=UPI0038C035DA